MNEEILRTDWPYTAMAWADANKQLIFPDEVDPALSPDGTGEPSLTPEQFDKRLAEVKEERKANPIKR